MFADLERCPKMRGHDAQGERGFAMIAVLVILLLVAAPVARFSLTARLDLTDASGALRQDQLRYIANGLLAATLHDLNAGSDEMVLAQDQRRRSRAERCHSATLDIDLLVQDQAGLVDLNEASAPLIASGLTALGMVSGEARKLAGAMAKHHTDRGNVAAAGEKPETAAPASFEAVEMLHNMAELRAFSISALRSIFTIHSRNAAVLRSEMPRELERELPFPRENYLEAQVSARKAWRVEIAVRDRQGTVGFAGTVAETGSGDTPTLLERYRVTPVSGPIGGTMASCSDLFGDEVTAWLGTVT